MSRGERFTQRAKEIMTAAQQEAETSHNNSVETPHLLLGILKVDDSLACRVLQDLRIEYDRVVPIVRAAHPAEVSPTGTPTLAPDTRNVLETAVEIARKRGDHHVGSEHLLLALVKGDDKPMRYLMRQINLEPQVVRSCVERLLQKSGGDGQSIDDAPTHSNVNESDPTATQMVRSLAGGAAPSEIHPRTRVLNMVESGTISAAEGAELLKAMRFAAVPISGSTGFVLLPFEQVNFDDLRQRTLRFTLIQSDSNSSTAEIAMPFEQAQTGLFRLLSAIYDGEQGTLIDFSSGENHLRVSID
ncbi:MAG: Clp protease N-terminal domain-containing protein [Chloroflexota bacterium]